MYPHAPVAPRPLMHQLIFDSACGRSKSGKRTGIRVKQIIPNETLPRARSATIFLDPGTTPRSPADRASGPAAPARSNAAAASTTMKLSNQPKRRRHQDKPAHDTAYFLDFVIAYMGLRNDADLGRLIAAGPSHICLIRQGRLSVSATLLVRIHDATGIGIRELRKLLARQAPAVPLREHGTPQPAATQRHEACDDRSPTPMSDGSGGTPASFLDAVVAQMGLRNHAELARVIGVSRPTVSKIKHGRLPVTAGFLLRIHEASGLAIAHLRALLAGRNERLSGSIP
jgi:transcriptional regulator with XRE-family HTH domain